MCTDHLQRPQDLAWKQIVLLPPPAPFHWPVLNLLVPLGCSWGPENAGFLEPKRGTEHRALHLHSCLTCFPEMIVNYNRVLFFLHHFSTLSPFFFQDSLLFLYVLVFSEILSLIKKSHLLSLCSPSVILSIFLTSMTGGFHFHFYHPYFCLDLLTCIFKCLPGTSI